MRLPGLLRGGLATLSAALFLSSGLSGQEHVVSSASLHQRVVKEAEVRRENLTKLNEFLSSAPVKKALRTARLDEQEVRRAAAFLSDSELARLITEAKEAQKDFAAGALSNEHLTYIVIALSAAVLVLIAT